MTQHTRKPSAFFLSFIILLLFSCDKISSQKQKDQKEIKIEGKKNIEKKDAKNWKFFKVFSLSPESNYICENEKYKNFSFNLIGDSVYVDSKYTDDVYITELTPKSYFEKKYLLETYKKRLNEELNLSFPFKIKTIRNKKAYDKSSKLDEYFQDAFFIHNYLFIEDNGCIYTYIKNGENSDLTNSLVKKANGIIYKKKININTVKYETQKTINLIGAAEFSCGDENLRYVSLPKKGKIGLILIPQDCGDFLYNYYLFTILDNKIISNLYVEGEWFEPENEKTTIEATSFTIDSNFIISVKTNNKEKKYIINKFGKIIDL
ncbi:hypothetical protein [Frigoriflavimonas asaccharolytica]|uniref:Lipoprotein n=1 Tax=Frigoriflavimonas asaccharolytica TaxID=2735899 RepID=A0A8J8G9J7_9FLAO|nr:hypothetical protein [Frigoriflavimonas asaccharolytica]NRS93849.1 hypothetical protein [Frigoriflavimonas asaccharolytica]